MRESDGGVMATFCMAAFALDMKIRQKIKKSHKISKSHILYSYTFST
jgi:hypothetical protein